jgi:hypothetical protein
MRARSFRQKDKERATGQKEIQERESRHGEKTEGRPPFTCNPSASCEPSLYQATATGPTASTAVSLAVNSRALRLPPLLLESPARGPVPLDALPVTLSPLPASPTLLARPRRWLPAAPTK